MAKISECIHYHISFVRRLLDLCLLTTEMKFIRQMIFMKAYSHNDCINIFVQHDLISNWRITYYLYGVIFNRWISLAHMEIYLTGKYLVDMVMDLTSKYLIDILLDLTGEYLLLVCGYMWRVSISCIHVDVSDE